MTTCTPELLLKECELDPSVKKKVANFLGESVNLATIKEWLDYKKEQDLANDLDKDIRPWEIIKFSTKLDPNQPWIGVEYETGYDTRSKYEKVINYVWDNFPWTAIDCEGCGNYPCEITFSPVNMDTFMSLDYAMNKLLTFQKANKAGHADHDEDDAIGTHVNISTPMFRKATGPNQASIVAVLNKIKHNLSNTQNKTVFGRVPYGGFFLREAWDHNSVKSFPSCERWIEGKLFDSTGDIDQWNTYKIVMANLAAIVDWLASQNAGFFTKASTQGVEGDVGYELLMGKREPCDIVFSAHAPVHNAFSWF